MQAAHLLTLLSTTFNSQFDEIARIESQQQPQPEQMSATHNPEDIFRQFFGSFQSVQRQPVQSQPKKSHEQRKSEAFERVTKEFTPLFAKLQKSISEGFNKGSLKFSNLSAVWPEESRILSTLFQRYLRVEMHDPSAKTRSPSETMVSISWEQKQNKLLAELLGIPVPEKESKTNSFRVAGTLTDCVLVVAGKEFPVHKVILAKKSPYFEALFSASYKESQQASIQIVDERLTPELFETFLEYIYTGNAHLANKSYRELIAIAEVAGMFLLKNLEFIANRLLITKITKESWREVASHALKITDDDILKSHVQYMLQHQPTKEQIHKAIEEALSIDSLCEYYELASNYTPLDSKKKTIEERLESNIAENTFSEYCSFALTLNTTSSSRKFLEKTLRSFIESRPTLLNKAENAQAKELYIKLLTGIVADL